MRLARSTGATAGAVILLLGLWGILIPFVGPYFHFGFGPDKAWHFTTNRLWLDILPGLGALIAGATLALSANRLRGIAAGSLALACGIWLLIGPSISMVWAHGAPGVLNYAIGVPLGGHDRAAAELLACFYGLGMAISTLSTIAVRRFASAPTLALAPASTAPPAPSLTTSTRRQRSKTELVGV